MYVHIDYEKNFQFHSKYRKKYGLHWNDFITPDNSCAFAPTREIMYDHCSSHKIETEQEWRDIFVQRLRQNWLARAAHKSFFDVNPNLKLREDQFGTPCGHKLRTGRRYNSSNGYKCNGYGHCNEYFDHSYYWDHPEYWKAWSKPNGIFLIAHPYNEPSDDYEHREVPEDLQVIRLPKKYSWYNPGQTYLTFIGRPEVLVTLNMDYELQEYRPYYKEKKN